MRERKSLIEAGRRMWERGLISGTDGNLSIRLSSGRILTTASGVPKGFMTSDDFVELSADGVASRHSKKKPSSEIQMHLAAYRQRPEIGAICHAHPPHATAFATAGVGMTQCVIPELIVTLGSVPLAPYATPSTAEVPASIEAIIATADAVLLENHGALTVGKNIFDALYRMEAIDHAAHIILLSRSLGGPREISPENVDKLLNTREKFGFANPAPRCGE